jgi:chromosome transmission fidelity protein 18
MLSPDVKPVLVNTGPSGSKSFATASVRKASEKALVKKAVEAMAAVGVRFERSRVEFDIANRGGGWILRMEPPLDQLAAYDTLGGKKDEKVRYAVRSVLDTEWKKESARMDAEARKRRGGQLGDDIVAKNDEKSGEPMPVTLKDDVTRDFFGRIIKTAPIADGDKVVEQKSTITKGGDEGRIWVSFNEGYSNAVRKPITLDDLMRGL